MTDDDAVWEACLRWAVYTWDADPATWGVSTLIVDRQNVARAFLAVVEEAGDWVTLPAGLGKCLRGVSLFVDAPLVLLVHDGEELRGWASVTEEDVVRGGVPASSLRPVEDRSKAA